MVRLRETEARADRIGGGSRAGNRSTGWWMPEQGKYAQHLNFPTPVVLYHAAVLEADFVPKDKGLGIDYFSFPRQHGFVITSLLIVLALLSVLAINPVQFVRSIGSL